MERTCRQIMLFGGRSICCLLILALASGCTSMRRVPLEPEGITKELEPGDRVHIVTRDGNDFDFVLSSVSRDQLAGEGQSVEVKNIAKVEKREISALKTAGAGIGTLFIVVSVIVIVALIDMGASFAF